MNGRTVLISSVVVLFFVFTVGRILAQEQELEVINEESLQMYELNTVDSLSLQSIEVLTDYQIASILFYRKSNGRFNSVYELQFVSGIDDDVYEHLLSVFYVDDLNKQMRQRKSNYVQTYIASKLTDNGQVSGEPDLMLRHKAEIKLAPKIAVRGMLEKDAKENLAEVYDYKSVSCFYNSSRGDIVVVGDYRLALGQGLVCSNKPFFSMTGSEPYKRKNVLQANGSFAENTGFRGIASSYSHRKLNLIVAWSGRDLNASTAESDSFTSLYNYSVHFDSLSLAKRGTLTNSLWAGSLSYRSDYFQTGLCFSSYTFDRNYKPLKSASYTNNNLSAGEKYSHYYKLCFKQLDAWGETALASNGSFALIHGFNYDFGDDTEVCLQYNYYAQSYLTFMSNAFSYHSYPANEEGWYSCLKNRSLDGFLFLYSIHICQNISDRYFLSKSGAYLKSTFSAEYMLSEGVKLGFMYRFKKEDVEVAPDDRTSHLFAQRERNTMRFNLATKISEMWSLRWRYEYCRLSGTAEEEGMLAFAEAVCKKRRLVAAVRLSFFDCDYDTRIYAYERSLPNIFSMPYFYGKGNRQYLYLKYKFPRFHCMMKLAHSSTVHDSNDERSQLELKTYFCYLF